MGLEIFAFPCNQFNNEEPGNPQQIQKILDKYGVNFPVFEKINVIGEDCHPVFKMLKSDEHIEGNFTKLLVDMNGKLLKNCKRVEPQDIAFDILMAVDPPSYLFGRPYHRS